ncbi:acetyltransferase (GNAT) family protein [Mumia flava]|uniref:Acetyltransferase (GNAT) family protein n=1 Tax=Mumia flava TaxID=1348852 RepID=A0A0B2BHA8_9ACTN|nr:GNAT family N-acetyltransferase [Mumia flava]PJJ56252.1 acetyltransferase (GNAT) family protein [Mumia flava]
MPTADTSVRVAWSADADAIAALQAQAWRTRYAEVLPADLLEQITAELFAPKWEASLTKPGDARNRVLVALERATVRGFAIVGPSGDEDADPVADGEVAELIVDPEHTGAGHGSRLLQACADTLRADRFRRATIWLDATDDALRSFVTGTGWAPDGAHREVDPVGDGTRLKQVRLHTALVGEDDDG